MSDTMPAGICITPGATSDTIPAGIYITPGGVTMRVVRIILYIQTDQTLPLYIQTLARYIQTNPISYFQTLFFHIQV